MIDKIDDKLSDWVEKILNGIKPDLSAPKDAAGTLAVNLYLLELVDDALLHSTHQPRLQPALRYLVTSYADEPRDAHRMLGTLVFHGLEHNEFEVELDPIASHIWSAFGIAPRPAFILRVPLPRERPRRFSPPVAATGPSTRDVPIATLYGQLFGPNNVPLAGARVDLPALNRFAETDSKGRFTIPGVPAAPQPKTLLIRARGQEHPHIATETGTAAKPVPISIDLFANETVLYGRLADDQGNPVPNATIEIANLDRATTTDRNGRFTLAGVPVTPTTKTLLVGIGNQQPQPITMTGTGTVDAPIPIAVPP